MTKYYNCVAQEFHDENIPLLSTLFNEHVEFDIAPYCKICEQELDVLVPPLVFSRYIEWGYDPRWHAGYREKTWSHVDAVGIAAFHLWHEHGLRFIDDLVARQICINPVTPWLRINTHEQTREDAFRDRQPCPDPWFSGKTRVQRDEYALEQHFSAGEVSDEPESHARKYIHERRDIL
jgi:hypothetical protein